MNIDRTTRTTEREKLANTIVFMFGTTSGPIFVLTGIGVLPIALFEFSLGVWLTVKGFNPPCSHFPVCKNSDWRARERSMNVEYGREDIQPALPSNSHIFI